MAFFIQHQIILFYAQKINVSQNLMWIYHYRIFFDCKYYTVFLTIFGLNFCPMSPHFEICLINYFRDFNFWLLIFQKLEKLIINSIRIFLYFNIRRHWQFFKLMTHQFSFLFTFFLQFLVIINTINNLPLNCVNSSAPDHSWHRG